MSILAPRARRPDPGEERLTGERCHILETWNRPDDPDLSVARARVEPGVTTRWHRLIGIAERYLILEGEGLAEVQGITPQALKAGDLLYIPPGHAQRIINTSDRPLVFYALCTPRYVQDAYQEGPTTD